VEIRTVAIGNPLLIGDPIGAVVSVRTDLNPPCTLGERVHRLDWTRIEGDLDAQGNAVIPNLISREECALLESLYGSDEAFGERPWPVSYQRKFLKLPLPSPIHILREALYTKFSVIANRWNKAMNQDVRFPTRLDAFTAQCHGDEQFRPLCTISRYRAGDYEPLHQDADCTRVFPLQLTILLSRPSNDFTGGELVMTEQRPRMQSRVMVLPLQQGDACLMTTRHRPAQCRRGTFRANLKHGISRIRTGQRYALDVIFHDGR
jgi:hypothetical protein